jgi:hypothetical protein
MLVSPGIASWNDDIRVFAVLEKKIFTKKKLKLVDSTGNTQSVDANNSRVVDAAV